MFWDVEYMNDYWKKLRKNFFIAIITVILSFVVFSIILGIEETKSQQPKVYISNSYDELKPIFESSSKNTDLQKDTIFEQQYKGKYVRWNGAVRDIDASILDNLRLYVNINERFLFDDYVIVYMNKDQYNKLIQLKKEDTVTFSGRFDSYTTTLGVTFYFKDGEIIE